jgi:hypothetical protein
VQAVEHVVSDDRADPGDDDHADPGNEYPIERGIRVLGGNG